MAHFTAHWGNRLEDMADRLFASLYDTPLDEPLKPCCIVTNSNVMQAWLRHYFVFDWPKRHHRILANFDFQLLYPFVNDWMDTLLNARDREENRKTRDARHHPYSTGCLQWRIFKLLDTALVSGRGFAPIKAWLGDNPPPRRRFQLAGRLATLFDDYQIFRCRVLKTWEDGAEPDNWQAILWRRLILDNPDSYAGLFRSMNTSAAKDVTVRFDGAFRHVAIFGTTAMPVPYLGFLQGILAKAVPVDLFVLNPSGTYWLEDVTPVKADKRLEQLLLEDHPLKEDPLMLPEKGHPLLCSLGQSLQEHLHALHELTEGGISDESFNPSPPPTMLADLQNRMLAGGDLPPVPRAADDSIQVHICHSARREVEVLHDHLLHWFTTEKLQPYQVLVLVTDMDTYAPIVDAVFGSHPTQAAAAIPTAMDGRPSQAASLLQNAFRSILHIASSRFPAPDIVDLLGNEPVMNAIGLAEHELDSIADFINKAGIRWGLDCTHRQDIVGTAMEPYTSWEYGLERLLAGYAFGSEEPADSLWPVDTVEDATAETLGRLVRFINQLKAFRGKLDAPRTPAEWQGTLLELADTFFTSTNETYREVAAIRKSITEISPLSAAAGLNSEPLPFEVIATFLDNAMDTSPKREGLLNNAVVFGQLRPMNSRPAEVICLLGMVDGVFPRKDNRPTFDLLRQTRCRGDRSIRRDDRCAFLEALVNARRRLFISYPGRSDRSANVIPPSIVLQELRDNLCQTYALGEDRDKLLPFETLHRMQGVHPAYFQKDGRLFSYSREHLQAAIRIAGRNAASAEPRTPLAGTGTVAAAPGKDRPPDADRTGITIEPLIRFFKNPAQYYYRDSMKLALDIRDEGVTSDGEPVAIDALSRYSLYDALITQLRGNGYDIATIDREQFTAQSKANARSPLGQAGNAAIQELLEDAGAWLSSTPSALPGCSMTILDLLKAQDATPETQAKINLASPPALPPAPPAAPPADGATAEWILTGTHRLVDHAGMRIQLFARPSGLKAKDRIGGWIAHLFACAAGETNVHTLLIGKKESRTEEESYRQIAAGNAIALLHNLACLYMTGQAHPIPFSPEASYAFAKAVGDDPEKEKDGREQAAKAWEGSQYARGDREDRWMFHAFGEEGPMDHPLFPDAANTLFGPLVSHRAIIAGDPENQKGGRDS